MFCPRLCRRLNVQKHQICWRMSSQRIRFIFQGQEVIQQRSAWWVQRVKLTDCLPSVCIVTTRPLLYANEVCPTQSNGLRKARSNCQTDQTVQGWSNMKQDSVTALPTCSLKCFQKHILVYCFSWQMRTFVTGPPSWKDLSQNQVPPKLQYVCPTWMLHCALCRDSSSPDLVCLYLQLYKVQNILLK